MYFVAQKVYVLSQYVHDYFLTQVLRSGTSDSSIGYLRIVKNHPPYLLS